MRSPTIPRVAVTSRSFGLYASVGTRLLEEAGCDVVLRGEGGPWDEDAMREFAFEADALIVGADHVTRRVLEACPHLRVVARHGAGLEKIDVDAAAALGVAVTYAPGASAQAVAEMTIAMLFALWRGLLRADRGVREGRWERIVGREVRGRILGLIGLGRIGRTVAVLARGLGLRVVAHDIAPDQQFAEEHDIHYLPLDEVLRSADAISIHTPLTPMTQGLIGARELALMRPDAVLLNTARGGVVDEQALATVLRERRLAGAALDVFEREPLLGSPLLDQDNAVLTPHIAAYTHEALAELDRVVATDVIAVLRGQAPAHPASVPPRS